MVCRVTIRDMVMRKLWLWRSLVTFCGLVVEGMGSVMVFEKIVRNMAMVCMNAVAIRCGSDHS